MNELLRNRINVLQKVLMAQHEAGKGLSSPTIGSEREEFIRYFLSRIFPNSLRFSRGDIVDADGNTAHQIDIALEFPFEPSFPMLLTEERLVLAESVIAAIEVKSDITQ